MDHHDAIIFIYVFCDFLTLKKTSSVDFLLIIPRLVDNLYCVTLVTALQGGPNHSHQGGHAQSKVHKDARGSQMVSLLYLHISQSQAEWWWVLFRNFYQVFINRIWITNLITGILLCTLYN